MSIVIPHKEINQVHPGGIAIGLVIGHNKKSQGAVNYLGETEYQFNKRIAKKIQFKLEANCIASAIIERPTGLFSNQVESVANETEDLKLYMTLHLHFNSSEKRARGCEALITYSDDARGYEIADYITDELAKIGLSQRHENGVKTVYKGHRGYNMLHAIESRGINAILIEPCFANHRAPESIKVFENEDKYVDVLVQCLYEIARGKFE